MYSFNHTLNVLVKAYLNDTLQKGNCHACAVGNLVADACGYTYQNKDWAHDMVNEHGTWVQVVCTNYNDIADEADLQKAHRADDSFYQDIDFSAYVGKIKEEIDATGYSVLQLADIEWAFESAAFSYEPDAEYKGLMAVVDVLADIHQVDLTVREQAKALFVKA